MSKIVYSLYNHSLILLIASLLASCDSNKKLPINPQEAIKKDPIEATQQIGLAMQEVAEDDKKLAKLIQEIAPNGKEIVQKLLADKEKEYTDFFPGCDKFTAIDMAVLVNHPQFNKIKRLSICKTELDQVSLQILLSYISKVKNLEFLFLDNNLIGDSGIDLLVPHLKELTKLQFLILTNNNISDKGLKSLAPFLSQLILLRHFYLDNNRISDQGMEYFATYLKDQVKLSTLKFSNNQIGDTGIQALISHFPKLPMLFTLDLSKNRISTTVKKQLEDKVKELGMSDCNLYLD